MEEEEFVLDLMDGSPLIFSQPSLTFSQPPSDLNVMMGEHRILTFTEDGEVILHRPWSEAAVEFWKAVTDFAKIYGCEVRTFTREVSE